MQVNIMQLKVIMKKYIKHLERTGFTGTVPTATPHTDLKNTVSSCKSIDISKEIKSGKYNYFKIESDDEIPSSVIDSVKKTGLMMATLNVIGYMK